jgi:Tfp pilus assembly protein PilX
LDQEERINDQVNESTEQTCKFYRKKVKKIELADQRRSKVNESEERTCMFSKTKAKNWTDQQSRTSEQVQVKEVTVAVIPSHY